jgi:hypothetical protein
VNGGEIGAEVIGGESKSDGNANRNTVNITGGTIRSSCITGGVAANGNVTGNTVNLIGGNMNGTDVKGGTTGSGQATNNTVNVFSSFVLGSLHGGVVSGDGTSSGNTLNLFAEKVVTNQLDSFQTINFYLPSTVKDGSAMLAVQDSVNLSGMTIGVGAEPGVSLEKGDTVFLIVSGKGIAGENIKMKNLNTDPIAEDLDTDSVYTFTIQRDLDTLVATVEGETEIEVPERTKSVVETKAATLTAERICWRERDSIKRRTPWLLPRRSVREMTATRKRKEALRPLRRLAAEASGRRAAPMWIPRALAPQSASHGSFRTRKAVCFSVRWSSMATVAMTVI